MNSSHPSDRHGSNLSPPIAAYIITAILGGALALIAIRFFPSQFIPQDIYLSPQEVATTEINKISAISPISQSQPNLIRGAIEKVAPAVVKIESDRSFRIPIPPIFNDPSLERFFGSDKNAEIPYFHRSSDGSGVVVREDGMILTNAHIVSGADNIKVTLKDGRQFVGTLVGTDSKLDLAVININTNKLPVAPLGKSQDLKLGDWVISVGNPFGRDQMVSLGIVSSLKYNDANNSRQLEWIQTDAVINSANSGGALINQKGEIVGINTAIRPDTKGIGFVIPIEKFISAKNNLFADQ